MNRRTIAACGAAALVGFASGAAGVGLPAAPEPTREQVRCFEDGSCTDGYCAPLAPCDDSRD